jgi:putative ubiquitin-RnfH superfamily antitoxin RatB of RatAB toxin-antitoxin module
MGMRITVVYSPRARSVQEVELELEPGATVADALQASGWLSHVGMAGEAAPHLGVWGRKAGADHVLQDHDRVEIYRGLTVDPKVARRARFVKQGARTTGLFARRRPGAKAGY